MFKYTDGWSVADRVRNRLVIASGTDYQTAVIDLRSHRDWTNGIEKVRVNPSDREIIYHHTASATTGMVEARQQIARMEIEASATTLGLPYNFIVWPGRNPRAYYLNDLDWTSPHTYYRNHHTAIAAWGNYQETEPEAKMVDLMTRLADAIATMWGHYVPESFHRHHSSTLCPGDYLVEALKHRLTPY